MAYLILKGDFVNHIEVMKQALGVLDQVASAMPFPVAENARKNLRAAIAEAESQQGLPEPKQYPKMPNVIQPAAQPTLKPLTDEQIHTLWRNHPNRTKIVDVVRAIEAAHGINGESK
jgi:hypothetical protein